MNHGIVPEGCSADVPPVETEARSGNPWTPGRWGVLKANSDDRRHVAALDHGGFSIIGRVRSAADAHLIAAAPALYDALTRARDILIDEDRSVAFVDAALSLARGEQA